MADQCYSEEQTHRVLFRSLPLAGKAAVQNAQDYMINNFFSFCQRTPVPGRGGCLIVWLGIQSSRPGFLTEYLYGGSF